MRANSYLRRRWRRWWIARWFLPLGVRDDLIPLLAWFELLRECESASGPERSALFNRLDRELAAVYSSLPTGDALSSLATLVREPIRRHQISELVMRKPLAAIEDLGRRRVLASRSELMGFARRLADPEAQILLAVAGLSDDRSRLQATALATGLQLTRWIERIPVDLAQGRVYLPVEDVGRFELGMDRLMESRGDVRMQRLVSHQIDLARTELAKGWPLADELGAYRGRCLAFVLRWNAATLSAIEARGDEVFPARPKAGWPRLLACTAASLRSTAAPF